MGRSNRFLEGLEKDLHQELNVVLYQEELMWFQKSRAKWLNDGDRNTRNYHLTTINHCRHNKIIMLRDEDGNWVEDESRLKGMANNFYVNLFSDSDNSPSWVQTKLSFPILKPQEVDKLSEPIEDTEVKVAVPGPDGFPDGFYQGSWHIIGNTICEYARHIWHHPNEIGEVNMTDICLISKVTKPEFINQFRPISLCNVVYKILIKIVVNRLKDYLSDLISPFQTSFIPGRSIHDNIVVAREMVQV